MNLVIGTDRIRAGPRFLYVFRIRSEEIAETGAPCTTKWTAVCMHGFWQLGMAEKSQRRSQPAFGRGDLNRAGG